MFRCIPSKSQQHIHVQVHIHREWVVASPDIIFKTTFRQKGQLFKAKTGLSRQNSGNLGAGLKVVTIWL